jgi:hypothetical protein
MTVSPELVHDTVRHPIAVGGPLEVTTRDIALRGQTSRLAAGEEDRGLSDAKGVDDVEPQVIRM